MCCVPWKKPLLLCQEIMIFQLIYIQRGAAELRLCFSGSSAGRVQLSASAACWVSHKVQKMTTKNYKRLQIIHLKKHIEASKKCKSLWKYCCWSSWPSQFFFSAAPLSCVGGQHWSPGLLRGKTCPSQALNGLWRPWLARGVSVLSLLLHSHFHK